MNIPEGNSSGKGGQIPEPERRIERLAALLTCGLLLLNFPLLSIFSVKTFFIGIPVIYIYLFSVWLLIVGVTASILRGRQPETGSVSGDQDRPES